MLLFQHMLALSIEGHCEKITVKLHGLRSKKKFTTDIKKTPLLQANIDKVQKYRQAQENKKNPHVGT